ncbi:ABC transporter permease subunit [Cytobacillus sp. IB215316]|uniref:ABC transporter permease subunit n=1 Tax=Cytobacillus sp. IB215316 TaxID=3097354 RepID=UPI002A108D6C|nr:ABC transporter permease subunit [Cytobacillus sp. IB215316]MDX8362780.1 ABC transporter permease subunit [Cytobacillus sp. IB215316]
MKQLVKFELYKIFRQKGIYISMILMLLLFGMIMFNESRIPNNLDTSAVDIKEELQVVAKKWEGKITEQKIEDASEISQSLEAKVQQKYDENYSGVMTELTSEEVAEYFILNRISIARSYLEDYKITLKEFDDKLNTLNKGDFTYKEALLEKEMLENLVVDTFNYNEGPKNTIGFASDYAAYFTGLIMLVGLASVFVNETSTGMDQLIYSTRHGRKIIVTAKIIAATVLILVITMSWVIFDVLMNTYIYGTSGWTSSIQNLGYPQSPYSLTGLEYFGIQIGAHILSAFAFMAFIFAVSAVSKSVLVSFIISAIVFILPSISMPTPLWEYVMKYSFGSFMSASEFINPFHAINVVGVPILDPVVHYPLVALLGIIFTIVVYNTIRRKQVA